MRTEGTSSSAESYEQMGKCCYKIANLLQKSFVSLQCSCISAHLHMYIWTFLYVACMYVCMCIYTYKKLNASNACWARDEWLSMQAKKNTKRREEKTAIFSSKKQQQGWTVRGIIHIPTKAKHIIDPVGCFSKQLKREFLLQAMKSRFFRKLCRFYKFK